MDIIIIDEKVSAEQELLEIGKGDDDNATTGGGGGAGGGVIVCDGKGLEAAEV